MALEHAQPLGSAGVSDGDVTDALAEGPPRAGWVRTAEASQPKAQADGPAHRAHTIEHSATCHADSGVMASDDGVQREAEIAQEVEAIKDLLGLRGTGAHALGEDLGAVAGDDLDTEMSPQPPGDTDGIPVSQQIDDGMPFEIDDHGPVAPPASPSPLVH
ncbi:hypothetical protein SAMN02799622_05865 [Methylobacterium sp. UNC378MF]|nr:hypothetical protein SAMN02799622_05865 [Methylobacterium sp. UNC378MF]